MVLFTFPMSTSHLRIWTMLFVRYVLPFLRWNDIFFNWTPLNSVTRSLTDAFYRSNAFCLRFSVILSVILAIYTRRWFPCLTPRPVLYWNNRIVILLQLGCLKFPFRFEMLLLMLYFTLALINALIFAFSLVFLFFCKDVVFKKHYNDSPEVLVCANHTTSGGNLNPLYNSISAWAEVRSYFKMKERFFNQ